MSLFRRYRGRVLRCCLCREGICLDQGFLRVERVAPFAAASNGTVVAYVCDDCSSKGSTGARGGAVGELVAAGGKPRGARVALD